MLNTARKAKKIVEKITNTHIFRKLPRGINVFQDIADHLPDYKAKIVFDIGANIGQSAKIFSDEFGSPRILCFEPVTTTFRRLEKNVGHLHHICCFQLAFGSSISHGKMVLEGPSDMHFLLGQSSETPNSNAPKTEIANILTIDEFCHTREIDFVSYLKIDTEGGDLDVLNGAKKMLSEQRIDLLQVEAGMNHLNSRHVPFDLISNFLKNHGYFLFGIYEQTGEWPTGKPNLRRSNPVFISKTLIETNKKP